MQDVLIKSVIHAAFHDFANNGEEWDWARIFCRFFLFLLVYGRDIC